MHGETVRFIARRVNEQIRGSHEIRDVRAIAQKRDPIGHPVAIRQGAPAPEFRAGAGDQEMRVPLRRPAQLGP